MKAIYDANVLLRALLPSPYPQRAVMMVFEAALAGDVSLLVMDELIAEVRVNATTKPTFARRLPPERTTRFIADVRQSAEQLPTLLPPFPRVCRDSKDDYLIAYALVGNADALVSYDQDLLVLDGQLPFRILTPPDFLAVLRGQGQA